MKKIQSLILRVMEEVMEMEEEKKRSEYEVSYPYFG
jgi:hypothetical protein